MIRMTCLWYLTALMIALLAGAAGATPEPPGTCTWGASSTIVEDGVQQPPATSGCIPS